MQGGEKDKTTIAGTIGLCLTLALWMLSSWRLVFHTLIRRRPSDERSPSSSQRRNFSQSCSTGWMTQRRTFHCLLWMSTSCEALAYADISGLLPFSTNRIYADKLGYVLLDVAGRSVLEMLAFSVVTALWLETAIRASPSIITSGDTTNFYWNTQNPHRFLLPSFFLIIMILVVISSVILSVVTLLFTDNDEISTIRNSPWSRAQTLLEGITWGLHAAVVIECIVLTSKRILALAFPPLEDARRKRLIVLTKALLPMFVSALCYILRFGWLVYHFITTTDNANTCMAKFQWSCWIGFAWCPTLIVVAMLLYSARKRDINRLPSISTDRQQQQPLLLGTPVPPAEAFLAFAYNRLGLEDDCDDSFLCGTPIQHVFTTPDDRGVVGDEETLSTDSEQPTRQLH